MKKLPRVEERLILCVAINMLGWYDLMDVNVIDMNIRHNGLDKRILIMATLAGEIMLSSGGETYRVEDTMDRILKSYPVKTAETFVTPTGIFASINDGEHGVYTIVKRIRKRTYHLGKVAMVNHLSRQFVEGRLSLDEGLAKLKTIQNIPNYPLWIRVLLSGVTCFSFTYMFGGTWMACIAALIIGLTMYTVVAFFSEKDTANVLVNMIGGSIISAMALSIIYYFPDLSIYFDKIIIGSIMPLVPGIGLTNAIRDIIEGDYVSGTSRILDAILVSVGIATGVGIVISLWLTYIGGVSI